MFFFEVIKKINLIQATIDVLNWESALLEVLHSSDQKLRLNSREINQPMNIWYETGRSFGDISESTMFQDIRKIMMGVGLMTLYVLFILSRFNWVELRVSVYYFNIIYLINIRLYLLSYNLL